MNKKLKLNDFLTISNAAKFLGVDVRTLRYWSVSGKIGCIRHPINKKYRLFKKKDLEHILNILNF